MKVANLATKLFSMDRDEAPLAGLIELKQRYEPDPDLDRLSAGLEAWAAGE